MDNLSFQIALDPREQEQKLVEITESHEEQDDQTKHYLSTYNNDTNNSTRHDDQDPDATNDNEDMKTFLGDGRLKIIKQRVAATDM